MRQFDSPAAAGERVLADLAARYSSPQRHYHTLEHLATMMLLLDEASPALQFAVWFHDAVYDTRRADNEERSAALAEEMLPALNIPADVRAETGRLIMLTKRHNTSVEDGDGCRLLDADLAILGAPTDEYDRYARAIRQEYEWVPVDDYRQGRRRVLEIFLQRPAIYFTDTMRELREDRARENLRRELALLA
jgi:predicted metal-dependent HD superfamily phosphohydrolase